MPIALSDGSAPGIMRGSAARAAAAARGPRGGGAARVVAAVDRAFERQDGEDVGADLRRELPQFVQRQVGEVAALRLGVADRAGDRLVRVAERQALRTR